MSGAKVTVTQFDSFFFSTSTGGATHWLARHTSPELHCRSSMHWVLSLAPDLHCSGAENPGHFGGSEAMLGRSGTRSGSAFEPNEAMTLSPSPSTVAK